MKNLTTRWVYDFTDNLDLCYRKPQCGHPAEKQHLLHKSSLECNIRCEINKNGMCITRFCSACIVKIVIGG